MAADRFPRLHRGPKARIVRVATATAAAVLIATGGLVPVNAARTSSASAQDALRAVPQAVNSGTTGAAVTPRTVTPSTHPSANLPLPVDAETDADAEVPPGMGNASATTNPPVVTGDAPAASPLHGISTSSGTTGLPGELKKIPASIPVNANGNLANLLAFTGATLLNTNCCDPPDTQMAMGNNEVFEAVNNNGLVFDRGGTLLGNFPLTDLFQPSSTPVGLTDPKVLFDPTAGSNGRYYLSMMVCENKGCGASDWNHMGISLAISDADNPLGTWHVYDYINDGQDLQDQPKLGFSGDKVTFAVNEYGCKCGSGTKFKQENVIILQKSDLIPGNSVTPAIYSTNSYSSFIFDSMPTTPVNGSTSDNTQYVVWDKQLGSSNQMAVIRITGTPNNSDVSFTIQTPSIADQTSPPAGVQQGSCVDGSNNPIPCTIAGDKMNLQSAMVQGNELWAVATDGCTPQNDNAVRACTRLIEVDLGGGGSSVVYDSDIGTQGTYRYNPAVMKDSFGNVYFGFTISSSTTFATAALDASSLPPPAVFPRINFGSGDATFTGGRWGDYSGLAQDPADTGDVWAAEEFGACLTACSSASNNWATAIGQFTFDNPHIDSVSPDHGLTAGGTLVDIYGADFANGVNSGTSVNFGSNPSTSVTWINAGHIQAISPAALSSGTVDIVATTLNGSSEISANDHFTYQSPPTAAFTFSPAVPAPSQPVSFDGSGSHSNNSGGSIVSYAWDFGDTTSGTGVSPSHTYAATGTYTVSLTVTDNLGLTDTITHDVTVIYQLTALSPLHAWIGLKNGDDQGTQFDVKVELVKNGTLVVASGLTRCITGVTRNPASAKDAVVAWDPFATILLASGDVLSVRLSTRIGTKPDDTKCSGPGGSHSSAVGLRTYYDASTRQSRFDATITPNGNLDQYLHSDGTVCTSVQSAFVSTRSINTTAPGGSNVKCVDSALVKFSGGNVYQVVAEWTMAALP